MAFEPKEKLAQGDTVADPSAYARCVVEHDPGGNATYVAEYIFEPLGNTFGRLAAETLRKARIAEGKGQGQVFDGPSNAGLDQFCLSEIGLRLAFRPDELKKPLRFFPGRFPPFDIAP